METDGPRRPELIREIIKQLKQPAKLTPAEQKQRISLSLKMSALLASIRAESDASECRQIALDSIARLPAGDPEKATLTTLLNENSRSFQKEKQPH
jgi:hypothetical protein